MSDCEGACRRWCAECLRVTALGNGAAPWYASALDASYVAATAARVLARRDDHDWGSVMMLVSACQQIATGSAARWRRIDAPRLGDCAASAEACAAACAALLRALMPASRRTEEHPIVDVERACTSAGAAA
ncbi:MAG TPA: hypothetical protein VL463_34685 [Kofleriaceae bacterium]|nr:hypothetical protein [Kofleriaceae bacterium]